MGNNGDNPDGGNQADAAYTIDLNLESDFGDYGGFFVHLEGGDGECSNDNVPSFSLSNYDAYVTSFDGHSDLTISEVFYEKGFFDDMFLFDIGKMDVSVLFDENEAAGDETTQFFSNIFVKSMGLTIPEPDDFYAPAMMFAVAPIEWLEWRVVGASVDNTRGNMWEDVFSNGFVATQLNFRPEFNGLKGNYRFYGWYDSRRYGKNRDLNRLNTDPSRMDGNADEGLAGWGLSFDQMLTEGITAFTRYSWTQDDRARWNGDDEQWEMQAFNSNLALSADFQWVGNPGGARDNDDVYIFGLRGQIDF